MHRATQRAAQAASGGTGQARRSASPSDGGTGTQADAAIQGRGETVTAPAGIRSWRDNAWTTTSRALPTECAIAFTYNRSSYAVLLATPADLEDLAIGFSLTEGIVDGAGDVEELEIVPGPLGVELRMWIAPGRLDALQTRRRRMAGPTGCGLCGLETLQAVARPLPEVPAGVQVAAQDVTAAMAGMSQAQALHRATRAVHAAGFWLPGIGLVAVREDVGRHNALDKLAGVLVRSSDGGGARSATAGVIVLTSRVSVELVQKAARMGTTVLAAMSVPTDLALRTAEACGITLIGAVREGAFDVFTHAHRLVEGWTPAAGRACAGRSSE